MSEQGKRKVAAVVGLHEQKARIAAERREVKWPVPGAKHDGVEPGAWREDAPLDITGKLPEDCPVMPLGYDGENFYFVDTSGQIFNTGTNSMGVERVQKLFAGHEEFLCWAWPAYSRDGKRVTGFKSEEARRDLYAACRQRGPFSMTDMVRGRGAWLDDEGRLILHCGEYLFYDGQLQDTGEKGEHFYVRRPAAMLPWGAPVGHEANPAPAVFEALRTWQFERGDVDCMFVMGWMGLSMMGAAVDWRPSVLFSGDAGTGKSSLIGKHGLIRRILGKAMIATTNATEAGLYQAVGHDSLPIAIDEMEGDDNPEQARRIIKMARDAASGSIRLRGGGDHKGVEFQAQSTFLFSAINPPEIPPASLTRLAIVQLLPLKPDAVEPKLKEAETIGPRLLRRIADRFSDFPGLVDAYAKELRANGHDSRGQKTFGTFLAAAHLLLGDEGMEQLGLPFEDLTYWGEALARDKLPELASIRPPWHEFLDYLYAMPVDIVEHGERMTVGRVLAKLKSDEWTEDKARNYLDSADVGLIDRRGEKLGHWLAIPHSSKYIGRAMADTPYGSRTGNGQWSNALRRGPPDIIYRQLPAGVIPGRPEADNRVSIGGRQARCLFVHVARFQAWAGGQ